MSVQEKVADGANGQVNDEAAANKDSQQKEVDPNDKPVKYETYSKVLSKLKKTEEQFETLQKELTQKKEAELKEKENFKELLKIREEELQKTKAQLEEFNSMIVTSKKYNAIVKSLNGELKQQYRNLIDVDKIAINPETGEPDEASVVKYAREFEAAYPETLKKANQTKVPDNAAQKTEVLTYEAWLKMPADEKRKNAAAIAKIISQRS